MSAPTVPPTTEPAPPATFPPPVVPTYPADSICYVHNTDGTGSTDITFSPCDRYTWQGEVVFRTEVGEPHPLPRTGSEDTVALTGGVCLLLGLFLIRITHRNP